MAVQKYAKYSCEVNGKVVLENNKFNQNILSCSAEQIKALYESWNETDRENNRISKANQEWLSKRIDEFTALFNASGLKIHKPNVSSPFAKPKKPIMTREYKVIVEALKNLLPYGCPVRPNPKYVLINGVEITADCYTNDFVRLVEGIKSAVERKELAEKKKKTELALAGSLAAKYGIALDDPDLLHKIREADQAAWLKETHPDGSIMGGGCDECGEWVVGERRCSCGSRRIYITIEGELGNWYAYPSCD